MHPPEPHEYAPFYTPYIQQVPDGDVLDLLEQQRETTWQRLYSLTDQQAGYRYAPGKWSIKAVVGHLSDAERVFAYRALRIGRNDPTPMPGFEQDAYVTHANFDACTIQDLADAFRHVRTASLVLFRSFDPEVATRTGIASDHPVSVQALAYIIAGHERHHLHILQERYNF